MHLSPRWKSTLKNIKAPITLSNECHYTVKHIWNNDQCTRKGGCFWTSTAQYISTFMLCEADCIVNSSACLYFLTLSSTWPCSDRGEPCLLGKEYVSPDKPAESMFFPLQGRDLVKPLSDILNLKTFSEMKEKIVKFKEESLQCLSKMYKSTFLHFIPLKLNFN